MTITAGPPRLVSQRLATQLRGTLVSGAGVHLAVWDEYRRTSSRLAYVVLAGEGEPLTPPLTLNERATGDFLAASDGTSFFVPWWSLGLHGVVVAPDGTIVEGPFDLPSQQRDYFLDALVWDGESYVLSVAGDFIRISRDGAFLERKRFYEAGGSTVRLHATEEGLLAFVDKSYRPGCQCGISSSLYAVPLDRNLEPDRMREEIWRNRSWNWWSWSGASAIAAGAGHRFLVRDDAWGNEGLRVAGDDGEFRSVPYGGALSSATWDGQEFLVTAGEQLVRHGPDGSYRNTARLPAGTLESTVAVGRDRVPLVLTERWLG